MKKVCFFAPNATHISCGVMPTNQSSFAVVFVKISLARFLRNGSTSKKSENFAE
jgi:hypothetical protein